MKKINIKHLTITLISMLFGLLLVGCVHTGSNQATETGADLYRVFARAKKGQPLRCVAFGGSITQASKGWIGPWLKEMFPDSNVTMYNAGMSATGSMLGMFRVKRDVINCQPDLVLIEFAVNDGGTNDDDTYWALESIVRRLKTLPDPPAIVFVQTASENKSKIFRHSAIAKHYGLFEVNLQKKVDAYLKKEGLSWNKLYSDAVHPIKAGHDFYTKSITEALSPYAEKAADMEALNESPALPPPFCSRKLILDGRLMPISVAPGWSKQHSLPHWWDMFFTGVIAADRPGTTMKIPVRGTAVGLFYALGKNYGRFYVNIDGKDFKEIVCNTRRGYTYEVLGKEMTPENHIINIALPRLSKQGYGVKLGYVLLGGTEGTENTLAPQGELTPDMLKEINFVPIEASLWSWVGPFGDVSAKWAYDKELPYLKKIYPPEEQLTGPLDCKRTFTLHDGKKVSWKPLTGNDWKVDFAKLTRFKNRGICYAYTRCFCKKAEEKMFALRIDYWGKIWVNGKLVITVDEGHGAPIKPIFFKANLKKGLNDIFVKVQSGSLGNNFSLAVRK